MDKENKHERIMLSAGVGLAVLSAAGIAAGTAADTEITEALYSPDSVFWRIVTIVGMYPFLAVWVLYMGVICRQVRNSDMPKKKKTVWTVICGYLGLSTSVVCSWAMFAADTIGGVFPQVINNPPVIAAGALFGVFPLFFLGYFTSKKEYDRELLKRLIVLCIVMTISLLFLETIKMLFCRPRYRLLIRDIQGIEFQPWYIPFSGSDGFITDMGIDWNDFRSFPSGHAFLCMGLIFALPPLADVYDLPKGGKIALFTAGASFAVIVCVSRMVMGAHFLSDVCMGSLIALVTAFLISFLSRQRH